MKKTSLLFVFIFLAGIATWAQAPQAFNYQGVARNGSGAPIGSTPISLRLSIHDLFATGTVVYQETQKPTTNIFGLFNVAVGTGASTGVGGAFNSIAWGSGNKYMQVEIDPAGGSSYTDLGASQLLSVPYALTSGSGGGITYTSGTGINITGSVVSALNTTALWNADELQGVAVSAAIVPTSGQVLSYNGTDWRPTTLVSGGGGTVTSVTAGIGLLGGTFTTAGTVSMPNVGTPGTYGSATVVPVITTDAQGRVSSVSDVAITGDNWGAQVAHTDATLAGDGTAGTPLKIAQQGATSSQVLQWSGTSWVPATIPGVTYTAGTGINIVGTTISAQNTTALWNANELQGYAVATVAPTSGQVLTWSGSAWAPATSAGGSYWSLTGNAGTNPLTNFVGTTDAQNLVFRVNNQQSGLIDQSGGNTFLGYKSGIVNTAINNTFYGSQAGYSNTSGSQNTSFGQASLFNNTTGNSNTAIGRSSLANSTTATENTAVGQQSLFSTSTGSSNCAIGVHSMYANTLGTSNVAIGYYAFTGNTTGSNNTVCGTTAYSLSGSTGSSNSVFGANALAANSSGYSNVALGVSALYYNNSGANLVAVGDSALYNQNGGIGRNTAIGSKALYANTTGNSNTAVGFVALQSNTTGYSNTATGQEAMTLNTTGNGNTGSGYSALFYNTTGSSNTGMGSNALSDNTNGNDNTATGANALVGNTTGNYNTGVGYNAISSNATGTGNTGVGYNANYSATGNYNTALGYSASIIGPVSNSMALGNGVSVTFGNQIIIGNSSISSLESQVALTVISDARVKNNIQSNIPGLAFIGKLNPVSYHYDINKENQLLGINDTANWDGKYDIEKIAFSGFLAQDVDATAKQIGYDFCGVDKSRNVWGIKYTDFIPSIVKAAQELNAKNEALEKTVAAQQNQINELIKTVQEIKNQSK